MDGLRSDVKSLRKIVKEMKVRNTSKGLGLGKFKGVSQEQGISSYESSWVVAHTQWYSIFLERTLILEVKKQQFCSDKNNVNGNNKVWHDDSSMTTLQSLIIICWPCVWTHDCFQLGWDAPKAWLHWTEIWCKLVLVSG